LYPNSAKEAAAEDPAKPVPTTITSYFLLFAGLTKLIEDLCFFHLSAKFPAGILDFNSILFYNLKK